MANRKIRFHVDEATAIAELEAQIIADVGQADVDVVRVRDGAESPHKTVKPRPKAK